MTTVAATPSSFDGVLPEEPEKTLTLAERLNPVVEWSASLVNRSWVLRSDSNDLHAEIVDGHTGLVTKKLDGDAQELAKRGVTDLLTTLADEGFAWTDIARLVGVSIPAVRKWRTGKPATGDNVLQLARLVALVAWLREEQMVSDVASWLEVPIVPEAPITRMDLLVDGQRDLLIRSQVGDELTPVAVLDEFAPGWHERYRSDFEVFIADDGQRSIRSKKSASD